MEGQSEASRTPDDTGGGGRPGPKGKKDCRLETDTIRSVLKIVAQLSGRKWQEKEARASVGRVGRRPERGAEEPGLGTRSCGHGRWSGMCVTRQCVRCELDTLDGGAEEERLGAWGTRSLRVWNIPWVAQGIVQP